MSTSLDVSSIAIERETTARRSLFYTPRIHCLLAWEPVSVPKHGYFFWQADGTKGTKRSKKSFSGREVVLFFSIPLRTRES